MTRLVQAAWMIPSLVLFCLLARDLIVEALTRTDRDGRSWCLDERETDR